MDSPNAGSSLIALEGEPLRRILEFLSVAELGQAELLCKSIKNNDVPFVWEKIEDRVVPKQVGPSVTLPSKDRVRRWSIANAYTTRMESLARQRIPDIYENGILVCAGGWSSYVPNIDRSVLIHSDYFVRLSRRNGGEIIAQGFVPFTHDDEGIINLSIDDLCSRSYNAKPEPEMRHLLEFLSPIASGDGTTTTEEGRRRMELPPLKLSVVLVDRLGNCNIVVTTESSWGDFRLEENNNNSTYSFGFVPRPVYVKDREMLMEEKLYTKLRIVCGRHISIRISRRTLPLFPGPPMQN